MEKLLTSQRAQRPAQQRLERIYSASAVSFIEFQRRKGNRIEGKGNNYLDTLNTFLSELFLPSRSKTTFHSDLQDVSQLDDSCNFRESIHNSPSKLSNCFYKENFFCIFSINYLISREDDEEKMSQSSAEFNRRFSRLNHSKFDSND